MHTISTRSFDRNGLTYTISYVYDEDPDISYLKQSFHSEEDAQSARERLEAYQDGDWHMIGICVDISIQTATNWAQPPVIGRSSLWGIESDSSTEYLADIEKDLIEEAEHDVSNLKRALCTAEAGAGSLSTIS